MRRVIGIVLLAFLALTVGACGSSSNFQGQTTNLIGGAGPTISPNMIFPTPASPDKNIRNMDEQTAPDPKNRIVLTTVSLSGMVEDPSATIIQLTSLTAELGGWIVNSSIQSNGPNTVTGTITMRIPAEKMQSALVRVRGALIKVTSENSVGQDVTQEFVDTTSQIANLEATEANLKKIMDEAKNTEDVLKVFNQMTTIRSQIDTAKGKIKYWSEAAAYSSITVNLSQKYEAAAVVVPPVPDWTPNNAFQSAINTLTKTVQGLVDILIWLVVFVLPFAIPVIVAWVIWRQLRRKPKIRA